MCIRLILGRALAVWLAVGLALTILATGCGSDGTGPSASLVGTWDLIGFTDMGIAATTTGTAEFRADGTFGVSGTIAFPGEPAEPLVLEGSYDQNGSTLVLTSGAETSDWIIAVSGNEVTLTEVEPPPANSIMLRRRS